MTRDQAKKVLIILEDNYPHTYKDMGAEQKTRQIDNYFEFFGEYEIAIIVLALKNYIKANKYPPTVAGLQEQINLILPGQSDAELWTALKKACCNGLYCSGKEYEKLPDVCQKWLGGSSALKELAMVESTILDTVVRGEFLKSVPALKARNEVQKALPAEVRAVIESENLNLVGGYDD